jgi:hypothetical protein
MQKSRRIGPRVAVDKGIEGMSKQAVLVLSAVAALGASGCNSSDSYDGRTIGEACTEMGTAYCERYVYFCSDAAAPDAMSSGACLAMFRDNCCASDETCGDRALIESESTYQQCKAEIGDVCLPEDGGVDGGALDASLPSVCNSI